ncbi:MAG: hypothetical protein AAF667_16400 [Pseudomonadota bacterium]
MYTRRKIVALSLAATAVALGGCGREDFLTFVPETPAEAALRESREALQSTVQEGSALGAAAGAAVGGLLGGVGGAFRGAQVGQLSGATAGLYVKQLQAQFAQEQQLLQAVSEDIGRTNAALEDTIAAMQQVLAEVQARGTTEEARVERINEEVEASVTLANGYENLFGETRQILISEAVPTGQIDGDLARLQNTVASMRSVAQDLSNSL